MNLATKSMIFLSMVSMVTVGAAVAVSNQSLMTLAESCEHEGNHYDALDATSSSSGTKEYWVCCKCHEHWTTQPSTGTWTDAGTASVIDDSSDTRYIPVLGSVDEYGLSYSADGKTVLSCSGDVKDVVIPEGVTSIASGAFQNKDLTSVTLPSTIETLEAKTFYDTEVARGSRSTNDVVIYINMTEEEVQAKIDSGDFDEDWDLAYASSPLGWGIFKTEHEATVVYADSEE